MGPSQLYFLRNQGEWNWCAHFEIKSWSGLWSLPSNLMNKLRIAGLVLMQSIFGPFHMWTCVKCDESVRTVSHSVVLRKLGVTWYRSEKVFYLNSSDSNLRLEGVEYIWPAMKTAKPFPTLRGSVDASTKQARYQMPLMGIVTDCRTTLEPLLGAIDIETPWLRGHFSLTDCSLHALTLRFFSTAAKNRSSV